MAGQAQKTARLIATAVLNQFDAADKRKNVGQILDKFLQQTNDNSGVVSGRLLPRVVREKQRATDLVFGTTRNCTTIDAVIAKLADCPTERIPIKLLNIIRIGAYELIYCPQTAEYAIVNEAVKNAKTTSGSKQSGFVNAVLRQITRYIQNRQKPLTETDIKKTLPQTPSVGCEFERDILPDSKTSPADYFSAAFSLPRWLVADWLSEFSTELTRQICFASNRRAGIYIRPNRLKTTAQDLAEKFRQAGIDFEIIADQSMIKVKSPTLVTQLPGFAEGLFTVQDITASQTVRLLAPQPGWIILDLCAAPGTKTTQLAELTGDKAKIFATDIDSKRLKKVEENTARLGISSVSIVAYEHMDKAVEQNGPFDCVLLDVPCSNTGVLSRRPEVRYRIKPKSITELTKIQSRLLEAAATMVRPGGKICYSTCSIQEAENAELIKEFLQKNNDFKLESELLTLPSAQEPDCDGGYMALLVNSKPS